MMASPVLKTDAPALNRVPEVTADFWIIKLLAVTVGETAADYMNLNLGLGLPNTSYILSVALAAALALQFAQRKYMPWAYWLAVVLISVVGTLLTDNLVDNFHVSLQAATLGFSLSLALTFAVWFGIERTLSIHTIFTTRREIFYWLAILFTFALGTAAGDLVAEQFHLGYLTTGLLFAGIIAVIAFAYFVLQADSILSFWLAYIFTRPLGASFGDLLAQPREYGGLGFGTTITSLIFLAAILVVVSYMTISSESLGRLTVSSNTGTSKTAK
jgi:uncharacterized membrane-anchored protein